MTTERENIKDLETAPHCLHHDEVWDTCLQCGKHWVGIIQACTCANKHIVKHVNPVTTELTKEQRIRLARDIIALWG